MPRDLTYDKQLSAIINLSDLKPTDPVDLTPKYKLTILAIHDATKRVQVLVEARNNNGLNQFKLDFPQAGLMAGDGTPDNHDEWRMIAFPRNVEGDTSPVKIFNRARMARELRDRPREVVA